MFCTFRHGATIIVGKQMALAEKTAIEMWVFRRYTAQHLDTRRIQLTTHAELSVMEGSRYRHPSPNCNENSGSQRGGGEYVNERPVQVLYKIAQTRV